MTDNKNELITRIETIEVPKGTYKINGEVMDLHCTVLIDTRHTDPDTIVIKRGDYEMMMGALNFYADPKNWAKSEMANDWGEKARQALQQKDGQNECP